MRPEMQKKARNPSKRHGWLRTDRLSSYLAWMRHRSSPTLSLSEMGNSWRNCVRLIVYVPSSIFSAKIAKILPFDNF